MGSVAGVIPAKLVLEKLVPEKAGSGEGSGVNVAGFLQFGVIPAKARIHKNAHL